MQVDPNQMINTNGYFQNMYPYPTYPQFPMQVMPQQPQRQDNFVWTTGKEGALVYPTAPGRTVIFRDDKAPYLYLKTTDNTGKTSDFQIYKKVEEEGTQPAMPTPEYVTKTDFESAFKRLEDAIANLQQRPFNKNNYQGKKGDR